MAIGVWKCSFCGTQNRLFPELNSSETLLVCQTCPDTCPCRYHRRCGETTCGKCRVSPLAASSAKPPASSDGSVLEKLHPLLRETIEGTVLGPRCLQTRYFEVSHKDNKTAWRRVVSQCDVPALTLLAKEVKVFKEMPIHIRERCFLNTLPLIYVPRKELFIRDLLQPDTPSVFLVNHDYLKNSRSPRLSELKEFTVQMVGCFEALGIWSESHRVAHLGVKVESIVVVFASNDAKVDTLHNFIIKVADVDNLETDYTGSDNTKPAMIVLGNALLLLTRHCPPEEVPLELHFAARNLIDKKWTLDAFTRSPWYTLCTQPHEGVLREETKARIAVEKEAAASGAAILRIYFLRSDMRRGSIDEDANDLARWESDEEEEEGEGQGDDAEFCSQLDGFLRGGREGGDVTVAVAIAEARLPFQDHGRRVVFNMKDKTVLQIFPKGVALYKVFLKKMQTTASLCSVPLSFKDEAIVVGAVHIEGTERVLVCDSSNLFHLVGFGGVLKSFAIFEGEVLLHIESRDRTVLVVTTSAVFTIHFDGETHSVHKQYTAEAAQCIASASYCVRHSISEGVVTTTMVLVFALSVGKVIAKVVTVCDGVVSSPLKRVGVGGAAVVNVVKVLLSADGAMLAVAVSEADGTKFVLIETAALKRRPAVERCLTTAHPAVSMALSGTHFGAVSRSLGSLYLEQVLLSNKTAVPNHIEYTMNALFSVVPSEAEEEHCLLLAVPCHREGALCLLYLHSSYCTSCVGTVVSFGVGVSFAGAERIVRKGIAGDPVLYLTGTTSVVRKGDAVFEVLFPLVGGGGGVVRLPARLQSGGGGSLVADVAALSKMTLPLRGLSINSLKVNEDRVWKVTLSQEGGGSEVTMWCRNHAALQSLKQVVLMEPDTTPESPPIQDAVAPSEKGWGWW